MGLISPDTTDPDTGYRYYSAADIDRILLINRLKDIGFSLAEIGEYLTGKLSADEQLLRLERMREKIEVSIAALKVHRIGENDLTVHFVTLPERWCVTAEGLVSDIADGIDFFRAHVRRCVARRLRYSQNYPNFAEFWGEGVFEGELPIENFNMRICICVDERHPPADAVYYPSSEAIAVYYRGDYAEIDRAYAALRRWVKDNALTVSGTAHEYYIDSPFVRSRGEYISCVVFPLA